MTTIADRKALVEVALAASPPDLVLANARLVNVLTREITLSDIAIKNGRIAAVAPAGQGGWLDAPRVDLEERHVAPGFIDAHVHVESSMVTVAEYAKAAIACAPPTRKTSVSPSICAHARISVEGRGDTTQMRGTPAV